MQLRLKRDDLPWYTASRKLDGSHLGVALPPELVEKRMAGNRLRNETQVMVNSGQINDQKFKDALGKAATLRRLEEIGGDYFTVTVPRREDYKNDKGYQRALDTGKVGFITNEREHDHGTDPMSFRHMVVAAQSNQRGKSGQYQRKLEDVERMASYLRQHVNEGSVTSIGTLGARGAPTKEEKFLRGSALLIDIDKGRNPVTGLPFNPLDPLNIHGTIGLDAGHFIAHASAPSLSNSPLNIGFQNQYENKGQSHAEKMAAQQGRIATGAELADQIFTSIINKATKDVVLPGRKGSKERRAFMDPINAQLS